MSWLGKAKQQECVCVCVGGFSKRESTREQETWQSTPGSFCPCAPKIPRQCTHTHTLQVLGLAEPSAKKNTVLRNDKACTQTHTHTHSSFFISHTQTCTHCQEPSAPVVLSAVVGTCDTADTYIVSVYLYNSVCVCAFVSEGERVLKGCTELTLSWLSTDNSGVF